jgi:S1-C subfamily serine protease
VIVRQVLPDSPAERAGLRSIRVDPRGNVRSFDAIVEAAGRRVQQSVDLIDALDDFEVGDVVKVRFLRDGETWEANVELEALD